MLTKHYYAIEAARLGRLSPARFAKPALVDLAAEVERLEQRIAELDAEASDLRSQLQAKYNCTYWHDKALGLQVERDVLKDNYAGLLDLLDKAANREACLTLALEAAAGPEAVRQALAESETHKQREADAEGEEA